MDTINLEKLSIKILIGCDKKPLSKRDITQNFKRHPNEHRLKAINELLHHQFIVQKELPKPNTRRVPTYHFITVIGKAWITNYLER